MKLVNAPPALLTNLEFLVLLDRKQRQLPSVELLLECLSQQRSTVQLADYTADREDGQIESVANRSQEIDSVNARDYLSRIFFFAQMENYVRETCPFLHLAKSTLQISRNHGVGDTISGSCLAVQNLATLSDRSSGFNKADTPIQGKYTAVNDQNLQDTNLCLVNCINPRVRWLLHQLATRFGWMQNELSSLINWGMFKPVEMYIYLDQCASRFTEDEVIIMLRIIHNALMEQTPLHDLAAEIASIKPSNPEEKILMSNENCMTDPADNEQHIEEIHDLDEIDSDFCFKKRRNLIVDDVEVPTEYINKTKLDSSDYVINNDGNDSLLKGDADLNHTNIDSNQLNENSFEPVVHEKGSGDLADSFLESLLMGKAGNITLNNVDNTNSSDPSENVDSRNMNVFTEKSVPIACCVEKPTAVQSRRGRGRGRRRGSAKNPLV